MWKLRNSKKEHLEHYIFVGDDFVVGRKDATLVINNDPSVSRKHAVLFINFPQEFMNDINKKSTLFLRDEKSKYGTFVNGHRVNGQVQLNPGDAVKFGQFESEYKVLQTPLVVTTSCLECASKKTDLKNSLRSIGGHLIGEWQPSCTHLVMEQVKVTVKAMCCLVSAKPIVKPDYFEELVKSLRSSAILLSPDQFVPPSGEALIDKDNVSFHINPVRKKLFEGKTFFFIDEKQYKKLHLGIVMGGGNASILSQAGLPSEKEPCVIEPPSSCSGTQRSIKQAVSEELQKKGLRMIPESDVGLAVVHCSLEKFCNPSVKIGASTQNPRIISQTLTEREVYVPNTEESPQKYLQRAKETKPKGLNAVNFSSVLEGESVPMDVSQVPLSGTIKQELDNIFGDDNASPPQSPPRKKGKIEPNRDNLTINKSDSPDRITIEYDASLSPTAQRTEVKTENGYSEPEDNVVQVEELPRNLVRIEVVSLIYKRPAFVAPQQQYNGVKNFKKFKKVQAKHGRSLPRIIGAHELAPFDRLAAQISEQVWENELPAKEDPQEGKGEFDWDTAVM